MVHISLAGNRTDIVYTSWIGNGNLGTKLPTLPIQFRGSAVSIPLPSKLSAFLIDLGSEIFYAVGKSRQFGDLDTPTTLNIGRGYNLSIV